MAGYEDTNDAERLAEDPTFRMLASRERREASIALTSTLHWFETDVLTEERNYQGLVRLNTVLIQHASARSSNRRVTLDIDSSESPVHGAQEQSAYNGHFESVCYHPLFVFNPGWRLTSSSSTMASGGIRRSGISPPGPSSDGWVTKHQQLNPGVYEIGASPGRGDHSCMTRICTPEVVSHG